MSEGEGTFPSKIYILVNLTIIMVTVTVSSKGQVVIPEQLRESQGIKQGSKVAFIETPKGILLVKIPKYPLKELGGIAKELNISSADIKKLRREDDEHDKKEYSS